jgi:hypothetical protein
MAPNDGVITGSWLGEVEGQLGAGGVDADQKDSGHDIRCTDRDTNLGTEVLTAMFHGEVTY